MKETSEVPRFNGIADPKCKCTPEKLCRRCMPPKPGEFARMFTPEGNEHYVPGRFAGKFNVPWNDAVRINNRGGDPREKKNTG